MRATVRLGAAAIMAAGLMPLAATSAVAAPPGNDESSGAVVIRLGTRVVQDTREATTTPQDAVLNQDCGAPETGASVWYRYTPGLDRKLILDASQSDYGVGLMVFEGPPSPGALTDCGPGALALSLSARQTYYFMAFSDESATGGRLVLSMRKAPPPPKVSVTLARRGLAYRGGAARLHGAYFCQRAPDGAELFGSLLQRAGRLKIPAEFYRELRCDGHRHAWTVRAVSDIGTFARGRARARVTIAACGFFDCREDTARHRVRLHWARSSGHRLIELGPTARLAPPRPLVERQRHWTDH